MQVGVDIKCMHTSFDGCGLSSFGDMATFQKRPNFPFGAWTIVHGHQKIQSIGIGSKNHASRNQYQVHAHQFWWVWSLQFLRYCYLSKTAKFPFWGMDYSPWSWKNLINQNQLKKFTQVGIDVKCMHTDFGGRGLSGFGDKISLWSIKVEKFNLSESTQKIHASRDRY